MGPAAAALSSEQRRREISLQTYAVLRRGGWRTPDELREAIGRCDAEAERARDGVHWLRSYVLAEVDGSLGTVCLHQAVSPEAIRTHAYRAGLPVDEIIAVTDTVFGPLDAALVAG